ncbi:Ger(x)C family spore germination protein [Paenibacillus athensensis]|uniref:Uncharacterized protein n=1 Tax=Paenibacillus athensensis TaxID=1967502 RepID=A0A4Y8Q3Z9_9BACL|nr:Ger(x)C family spore germination protein [Paenibacillus athensensis]MCD1258466.1 Ger(x)C family spore germination protein [Paenibacillus athensensis]
MFLKKLVQAAGCCACLMLAGCWDRVEIDQRGFVVGIAIDESEERNTRYLGTYQFVVPGGLKMSSPSGSSSYDTQAYMNLGTTESSMSALSAKMASETSRSPYFEHLKLIIVSDSLARKPEEFSSIMDYFLRNSEMRRGIKVLIADGSALSVLSTKPKSERIPASYIESIVNNNRKTTYMLPETAIGQIHEYLMRKESYVVQRIANTQKQGVSVSGCAIFDGNSNRMVGQLNGQETQGLNMIKGQIKGGVLEAAEGVNRVDFLIERGKRTIRYEKSGNRFIFHINIQLEGVLDKSPNSINFMKKPTIVETEEILERKMQAICYETIHKLQQTYRKDVLGLGMYLYENHYKVWKPIAANWDNGENLFSQADIQVHTNVILRRIGNINKSHSHENKMDEANKNKTNNDDGE